MFKEIIHKLQYEDVIVVTTTREFYSPRGNYNGTLYNYYNENGWLTRGQDKYIDLEDYIRPSIGESVRSSYSYNVSNSIPMSLVHYTRIVKNATPDWNEMQKCPAGDVLQYWSDPYCIVMRSYKPEGHFEGQPFNSKYRYDYPWKQVARRSYLWVVPFDERNCWKGRRVDEGYTLYPNRKAAMEDMYKK